MRGVSRAYPLRLNLGKNVLHRNKHCREHATLSAGAVAPNYLDHRYIGYIPSGMVGEIAEVGRALQPSRFLGMVSLWNKHHLN